MLFWLFGTWIFLRFCAFQTLPLTVTETLPLDAFWYAWMLEALPLTVVWALIELLWPRLHLGRSPKRFFVESETPLALKCAWNSASHCDKKFSHLSVSWALQQTIRDCLLIVACAFVAAASFGRSVFLASETPWLSDSAFLVASETPLLGLKMRWNKVCWDQEISSTEIKIDGDFLFLWNQEVLWSSTMVSTSFFTLALSVSLEGWSTRPKPNPYTSKYQFNLHEEVDAYEIDGWWVRVVTKVLDNHDKLQPHSNSEITNGLKLPRYAHYMFSFTSL